jgi:hypothetical protein
MNKPGKNKTGIYMRKAIRMLWPFIPALIVFLCIKLAVRNSQIVETYYSKGLYPLIARLFSSVSRLISISLWDISWVLIITLLISGLLLVILKTIKPGWYILRILQLTALLYSFFYISWGFNYFRPDFGTRIGWKKTKVTESMFRTVLDSLIIQTNRSYSEISICDFSSINKLVEASYRRNSAELGISYPNGFRRTKTMLLSSLFLKFGISGYFGPFFNEVHLNYYLLPSDYPFTLSHEKAHQFGIASEAEANLAAFIVCTGSEDQRLRYSAYRSLLQYFLSYASYFKDYPDYEKKIDKRVIEDMKLRQQYYLGLRNKAFEKTQTFIYNIFLKSNHISSGVMNYNQVVELLIDWYNNPDRRAGSS